MTDPKKPFIAFRNGWGLQITPQTADGWRAFGWWMGGLLLGTGLFIAAVASLASSRAVLFLTACFTIATLAWAWAMIRWMLARSEVVETDDLAAFKREQARRGASKGRRP